LISETYLSKTVAGKVPQMVIFGRVGVLLEPLYSAKEAAPPIIAIINNAKTII
jgi:hypothetical protein